MSIETESPLTQFTEALDAEEREFLPVLTSDNLGLLLRSAINELDCYAYNMMQSEEASSEQEERFYLLSLGVTRLIKLSLEGRPSFDIPAVMFCRNRQISISTLEVCSGLGMIEHGRRVAQAVTTGMCRIARRANKDFLITLPATIPDEGHFERAVSAHYRAQSRKQVAALLRSKLGRKLESKVRKQLEKLVYPFAMHFIGYGADPVLDAYPSISV